MTATKTAQFGDAVALPRAFGHYLCLHFHAPHLPLRWSHCSATANFLCGYYGWLFRGGRSAAQANDLAHSLAYLANELMENAVKFRLEGQVKLEAGCHEDEFLLRLTNHISRETSDGFQKLLAELTSGDPGELLLQKIEANAASDQSSGSGLGILTMMNDYGIRFCWTFTPEPGHDDRVLLETLARLHLPA